ncbi:MAG: hypothetical protein LC623_02290 [Halobacteriales archaeon]|nr:hypothetical protein [Halobacteriales archaeon]
MSYSHTTKPLPSQPRHVNVQGHTLDTGVHFQRFCNVRGVYVIQCLNDPLFCLETPHRIPELRLGGKPQED